MEGGPMPRRYRLTHSKARGIETLARRVVSAVRSSGLLGDGWEIGYSVDDSEDQTGTYDGVVLRLVIVSSEEYDAVVAATPGARPGTTGPLGFGPDVGAQSVVVYNFRPDGLVRATCTWNFSELGNRSGTLLFYMQLYIALRTAVGTTTGRADFTLDNMTDVPARAARPGGIYGTLVPDKRPEGVQAFVGKDLAEQLHVSEGAMRLIVTGDTTGLPKRELETFVLRDGGPPWGDETPHRLAALADILYNKYGGGSKSRLKRRQSKSGRRRASRRGTRSSRRARNRSRRK